jgi:putative nucleotidyltransferase with HDIG domain
MHKGRILIVDDDAAVRGVLEAILAHTGRYETDFAENGRAGIERLRNGDYDIAFTDLTMPGASGIDFLREAAKLKPALPVVVITGDPAADTAVNAMREGARDVLAKPFTLTAVTTLADRLIGERRLLSRTDDGGDRDSFITRLNADLFRKLHEIGVLQTISTELDGVYANSDLYQKLVEMAVRLLPVGEASFGIIEHGALRIKSSFNVAGRELPLNGVLAQVAADRRHAIASCGELNPHNGRVLGAPFLAIPFTLNSETFGILSLSQKQDGSAFTDDEVSLALTFARKAAQRIENNALYEVFYNNLINTLKSLVISIEARDSYTRHHSERVTDYSLRIAEKLGVDAEDREALRFGGYLHDIGKIGVRDTVLLKPGALTQEERGEINQHPVIGGNIMEPLRFFPREKELILHHHEHFDGSGYPGRLVGDDIPLTSRVLAVADAYDAITSTRPYRGARPQEYAVAELKKGAGTQFDGRIVNAFSQALGDPVFSS